MEQGIEMSNVMEVPSSLLAAHAQNLSSKLQAHLTAMMGNDSLAKAQALYEFVEAKHAREQFNDFQAPTPTTRRNCAEAKRAAAEAKHALEQEKDAQASTPETRLSVMRAAVAVAEVKRDLEREKDAQASTPETRLSVMMAAVAVAEAKRDLEREKDAQASTRETRLSVMRAVVAVAEAKRDLEQARDAQASTRETRLSLLWADYLVSDSRLLAAIEERNEHAKQEAEKAKSESLLRWQENRLIQDSGSSLSDRERKIAESLAKFGNTGTIICLVLTGIYLFSVFYIVWEFFAKEEARPWWGAWVKTYNAAYNNAIAFAAFVILLCEQSIFRGFCSTRFFAWFCSTRLCARLFSEGYDPVESDDEEETVPSQPGPN